MSKGRTNYRLLGASGLAVIAVIICLAVLMNQLRSLERPVLKPEDRKVLPALEWKDLAGTDWKLAEQKGHVTVVNYFATWCGPCRQEIPDLNAVAAEFGPRGVSFAAISIDTEEEMGKPLIPALQQFAEKYQMKIPVLLGRPANSLTDLRAVPTTVVIDKQGRAAKVYIGQFAAEELRHVLSQLIAEN